MIDITRFLSILHGLRSLSSEDIYKACKTTDNSVHNVSIQRTQGTAN